MVARARAGLLLLASLARTSGLGNASGANASAGANGSSADNSSAANGSDADNSSAANGSGCSAPAGVSGAFAPPCVEGGSIAEGGTCTARCEAGHTPSRFSLSCANGSLSPAAFECESACSSRGAAVPAALWDSPTAASPVAGACADSASGWCSHPGCGALAVFFAGDLEWAARGLFGDLACATFARWGPGGAGSLASADVLVVSSTQLLGLPPSALRQAGLAGAVALLDEACSSGDLGALPLAELQQRRLAAGLAEPPGNATAAELAALLRSVGGGFCLPPQLWCWGPRVLYIGGDRAVAAGCGATLELPPGAWALSGAAEHGVLRAGLAALRAAGRPAPAPGAKPRLLAYLSHECSPEAEYLFDIIYDALSPLGPVEALGDCYGSRPRSRPARCRGRPCVPRGGHGLEGDLRPYRFALVVEASANSSYRCPRLVGPAALSALAAGAIPVFRGPVEAHAVLNRNAMVHSLPSSSVVSTLHRLLRVVHNASAERAMATSAALAPGAARWFEADRALRGEGTALGESASALLHAVAADGPHGRCLARLRSQSGVAGGLACGAAG